MLTTAWEIYVNNIMAPLFTAILETAMFFAQFGIAGLFAVVFLVLSGLATLVAVATRFT